MALSVRWMHNALGDRRLLAVLLSLALHALVLGLVINHELRPFHRENAAEQILHVALVSPPAQSSSAAPPPAVSPSTQPAAAQERRDLKVSDTARAAPVRPHASVAAPPPPTAQEWAFAARYPLKNSKGYRHSWGQQVRSLMGTAVEGPDQGVVRFQIEIAPDGTLTRLETLWTTSAAAEQRAREAIGLMPPLPPTPSGQVLVFERTISFSPFVSDIPPIYKDDCLPDPPAFRNRFAWNGQGSAPQAAATPETTPDPLPLEDCLKLLPQDSIEAEAAHDQRQLNQWRSGSLGR